MLNKPGQPDSICLHNRMSAEEVKHWLKVKSKEHQSPVALIARNKKKQLVLHCAGEQSERTHLIEEDSKGVSLAYRYDKLGVTYEIKEKSVDELAEKLAAGKVPGFAKTHMICHVSSLMRAAPCFHKMSREQATKLLTQQPDHFVIRSSADIEAIVASFVDKKGVIRHFRCAVVSANQVKFKAQTILFAELPGHVAKLFSLNSSPLLREIDATERNLLVHHNYPKRSAFTQVGLSTNCGA